VCVQLRGFHRARPTAHRAGRVGAFCRGRHSALAFSREPTTLAACAPMPASSAVGYTRRVRSGPRFSLAVVCCRRVAAALPPRVTREARRG
jgi:hypothetical protein